ncbi:isoprenoid synthase domain-containing protein [Aspergillus egyptiacus]|nr:isoprenoid synthase domain-containing protein [Aspergillus egyptiacus]
MPGHHLNGSTDLQEFRQSIRGQKATLPNFYTLFPDWKPVLHPEYERARDEVLNPWIQRWVPDSTKALQFQKAEFGVFAAVMCAGVSFEKLATVSKAFAWYFIWDDLFDCGSLTGKDVAATEYREISMQYFRAVLCNRGGKPDLSAFSQELQKVRRSASHLEQNVNQGTVTLELLLEKKLFYVSSVDTVDMPFRGNQVPLLTDYLKRRERTAGVYPVIATIPFIYGVEVSRKQIGNDLLMRLLWRHTSYLVHMINDMFSLRKEIADNQIENIVPVLMLNLGVDCNQAMQLSHQLAQEANRGFLEVEHALRCIHSCTTPGTSDVFIEGCRNIVMGLTYWSYSGQRYFTKSEANIDNEIAFHL